MLTIHTVPEAVALMLVGIGLLGAWPAVWHQVEQAGRLPAHTFLDYALSYLVFATTAALTLGQLGPPAATPAGVSLQFLDQLCQPNAPLVAFALAGGTCLALGDLALQYCITLCGLSVGPPVLNAVTLLVAVVLLYFLDGGINKPQLVFTGAAFAAAAIGLGAAAHVADRRPPGSASGSLASDSSGRSAAGGHGSCQAACAGAASAGVGEQRQRRLHELQQLPSAAGSNPARICLSLPGPMQPCTAAHPHGASKDSAGSLADAAVYLGDAADGDARSKDVGAGSLGQQQQQQQQPIATHGCQGSTTAQDCAAGLSVLPASMEPPSRQRQQPKEQQQLLQAAGGRRLKLLGLAVALTGGIIYGCFMPAFQVAANDPFKLLRSTAAAPLSVYTTYFFFAVAFAAVSAAVNAWLLYRPALGRRPSSLAAYLGDNNGRLLSVCSGVLAAGGDLTQFLGGQTAGYAAAMMVMAYPVVGVLWSALRTWRLHRNKQACLAWEPGYQGLTGSRMQRCCMPPLVLPRLGLLLVGAQVVSYSVAVGLLAGSAELRVH